MNESKVCLFIDDDQDDQEIFKDAVSEIAPNIVCHLASDCESAMTLLYQLPECPDIIFLDLNMPRVPGKECLDQIKKIDRFCHVPVIIYSTSSNQKDKDDCYELGASYFLTKPSGFAELKEKLRQIFSGEVEFSEHSRSSAE